MRKHYLRILMGLIGVATLGMAAKGQNLDQVVVNIPYHFVAAGITLPAGNYRVNRVPDQDPRALVLYNFDANVSAIVLVGQVESNQSGKALLRFERVSGEAILSQIQTADHLFTIQVPRAEILEAAAKAHGSSSGSGSAMGSN